MKLNACANLGHRWVKPPAGDGYAERCVHCGTMRPARKAKLDTRSTGILQAIEPVYRRKRGR